MIDNNMVMKLMSYGRKMNISVKGWEMEDRSPRDNLRIDGLKKVGNETWEQTEQILKRKTRNWRCKYWKTSQGG